MSSQNHRHYIAHFKNAQLCETKRRSVQFFLFNKNVALVSPKLEQNTKNFISRDS
jgi:hypothetical protein